MAAREKPLEKEMAVFVKAHLGRDAFAAFTGTDYRAWSAWCHLLRLWGSSQQPSALNAMRETLRCAQRKSWIWQVFVQTIPGALDWGYVKRMWPEIVEPLEPYEWPRDLAVTCGLKEDDDNAVRRGALKSFFATDKPDTPGIPVRRYGLGWS